MVLDSDKHIENHFENDLPLTYKFIENLGFKYTGTYGKVKYYKYNKSGLGVLEIKVVEVVDIYDKSWNLVGFNNKKIRPEFTILVFTQYFENKYIPINNYFITQGQLKDLIRYRKLKAKIHNLEHQAADLQHTFLRYDQVEPLMTE